MAGFDDYDVFDVHHHVGDTSFVVAKTDPALAGLSPAEFRELEVAKRLEIMDEGGVQQCAVIPGHAYARPNGHADTQAVNDSIAAYRDNRPDRFPVAMGIVEPQDRERSFDELARCRDELGIRAISFHVRFQGVGLDSPWVYRYVERMGELDMVPVLRTQWGTPDEALWMVAALGRAFPDLEFLVLGAYLSYDGSKEVPFFAEVAPNLVFDTSFAYNLVFIREDVRRFGADRFCFGSDLYSWPLGTRIGYVRDDIASSDMSDAEKRAVLGGTARRLFGLSQDRR